LPERKRRVEGKNLSESIRAPSCVTAQPRSSGRSAALTSTFTARFSVRAPG